MSVDFDTIYNRINSNAAKFDELEKRFGRSDIIPMWVADMDFPAPKEVAEAIVNRAEHSIFGYVSRPDAYYEAMIQWYYSRHNWEINKQWVAYSPSVVATIVHVIDNLTKHGDGIALLSPVYTPFYDAIEGRSRKVLESHLIQEAGEYIIDYDSLDCVLSAAKVFILCNPHNPVGRVWKRDELLRIGDLCIKYGVRVIADEIHADFAFKPNIYIPFASLSKAFNEISITCLSATKTFNLAGLQSSFAVFPRADELKRFESELRLTDLGRNNCFSLVAVEAAYLNGEVWLDSVKTYLAGNIRFVKEFLSREMPEISVNEPEGTYLIWLDCTGLGMDDAALKRFMVHEARLALGSGINYGPGGTGYMRMNIACSRQVLKTAMERMRVAVYQYRSSKKKENYQMDKSERAVQGQLDAYNQRDIEAFMQWYTEDVKAYDLDEAVCLFEGYEAMRDRYAKLFENKGLKCTLKNRMVLGQSIIDHEQIARDTDGPFFEAIAIYDVHLNGKIQTVRFTKGKL